MHLAKEIQAVTLLLAILFPTSGSLRGMDHVPLANPVEQIGLSPGDRAPTFRTLDQFGHEETIQSLMGKNGLVLLFFRSADW